jgi:nitrogenase-associated protein
MKHLIFYEKTGCVGNARQQKELTEAGFTFDVRSLLDEAWTKDMLRPYFGDRPVKDWFNDKAPDVKSGHVKPDMYSEDEAIEVMIQDPILIRRPLIDYDGVKCSGFDDYVMYEVLKLDGGPDDLEVCQSMGTEENCQP